MYLVEARRAPNPRRVRIFLAEKQIEIECRQVDIMTLEHKQAEHEANNPFTRVPYLVLDDGTVIAETMAICRYFDALHPEPDLFGKTALEQAMVEMWQRRVELNLFQAIAFAFRHTHPAMAPLEQPQVPEWGEANRPRVLETLAIMNGELAKRRYLAGESFSVADITGLCAIDFMKVTKFAIDPDHDHLKRWHADVSARPSAGA